MDNGVQHVRGGGAISNVTTSTPLICEVSSTKDRHMGGWWVFVFMLVCALPWLH